MNRRAHVIVARMRAAMVSSVLSNRPDSNDNELDCEREKGGPEGGAGRNSQAAPLDLVLSLSKGAPERTNVPACWIILRQAQDEVLC